MTIKNLPLILCSMFHIYIPNKYRMLERKHQNQIHVNAKTSWAPLVFNLETRLLMLSYSCLPGKEEDEA